jgi:hypothetical protein
MDAYEQDRFTPMTKDQAEALAVRLEAEGYAAFALYDLEGDWQVTVVGWPKTDIPAEPA